MGSNQSVQTTHTDFPRNSSSQNLAAKSRPLTPSQKLAKLLAGKSHSEDSVEDSITLRVFQLYVFPRCEDIGYRLFKLMSTQAGNSPHKKMISETDFVCQIDKILCIMADKQISLNYVTMFGENGQVVPDDLKDLLMAVYKLAMNYYAEGPQSCRHIFTTLQAIVDSAFHKKDVLTVNYVSNWLDEHCPQLTQLLHRFVCHMLSTAHHNLEDASDSNSSLGLELTTPVLEKSQFSFENGTFQHLLPISQVWILAMTLPNLYTRPQVTPPAGTPTCAKFYLSKMLGFVCPSHWTLLYSSNQHGLGANRFIHHVSNYRGPTLTFIRGDQGVEFCLGATQEWKESHQFWGSNESIIIQILPLYRVVERGAKLMYINMTIRGYPHGIRAGSDPRNPAVDINSSFSVVNFQKVPYQLDSVEVWGCGPPQQRDAQLDIKKWEGKEIEKARRVKMSADEWTNHPDRYLLELAGRQSYRSS